MMDRGRWSGILHGEYVLGIYGHFWTLEHFSGTFVCLTLLKLIFGHLNRIKLNYMSCILLLWSIRIIFWNSSFTSSYIFWKVGIPLIILWTNILHGIFSTFCGNVLATLCDDFVFFVTHHTNWLIVIITFSCDNSYTNRRGHMLLM